MLNPEHSGVWKKFHGGTKDTRSFRWSAKAPEPVRTSFDHFVDNTGHGQTSYVAAREAAAVANQEEMDRRRNEDMAQENAVRVSVRRDNRRRERYTKMMKETKTKFEQERLSREQRYANAAIMIAKMWRGTKTRSEFKKQLQQKAEVAGVSEAEIARIVREALRLLLTSL